MRVIAGTWKGRRLKSPAGDKVRPTTDRVKEALFNILGPGVRGCLFVDLCCGAGGLGIEALSRGAEAAILVDLSRKSLALARENLALCGADNGTVRLECADAVVWLSEWGPSCEGSPWILVADPPYRSAAAGAIMGELERLANHPGFVAAVVEHGARTPDLPAPGQAELAWEIRRYGESQLAVARPVGPVRTEGD